MIFTENGSEEVRLNEGSILQRGHIILDELRANVHSAGAHGYDYIEVSQLENALIALAVINGATHVSSIEAAIDYLEELKFQEVMETDDAVGKLEKELEEKTDRIEKLESVLAEYKAVADGTLVEDDLLHMTTQTLEAASHVLARVPGQRDLARQALRTIDLLKYEEATSYIPVDKDELRLAFAEAPGSAQSH